jgi:hypothetical protein
MLSPLRYFFTLILVILLSGASSAFVVIEQTASYTEQNEKIESENFVDEAIPTVRSKKQIAKHVNPFLRESTTKQKTTLPLINSPLRFGESYLYIKYRKLII